jgi:CDP-glycerol glycerophosphotransferase
MPLLSLVVPVHGVEGYLRECLDSILGQAFTDVELIAVDDASPDHCPAILDEYAARDARLRVIHLERNVGLGPARNVGLDLATGEYVWFVDSDDWLAPGALGAVARRLRETRPDVLVVDHTRVNWLGKSAPSAGRHILADVPPVVGLADEPRLLDVLHVAWNKVVRREFLVRAGLRFEPGWYEDVPFTFPVLVMADRVTTVSRVCYHYRQRRDGAITQSRSDRHFEVLDQWSRTWDTLSTTERTGAFRPYIFARMIWHLLVVASRPERLPPRRRRDFFERVSGHYHRYRPAQPPVTRGRFDQVRLALVAHDRYLTYRALRRARRGVRRARRYGGAVAREIRRTAAALWAVVGIAFYHLLRLLPRDPRLAVYAAYWYRGVSCNPAAIYAKAQELRPDVRGVWVVDRKYLAGMPEGTPYVVAGTLRYYRVLARATWFVNNVNFPDFLVRRRGSIHVQTHHGTPVKTMGVDQARFPVGAKGTDFPSLLRRCDRWDFSISSNAHSTECWTRSYPCRYQTLEVGYPRNDRLATAGPAEVAAAREALGIEPAQTVVLYAPTHREFVSSVPALLDVDEFAARLGPGVTVLSRAHYFADERDPAGQSLVRDVSRHPVVEDLLLAADVLVTDYSSVMFDYAVLDRPIAIYAPDWDAYRRTRGTTYDVVAEPPGVVATNLPDLVDAFDTGSIRDDAASKARTQFRARFCYLDDGGAAERVVRRVFAVPAGAGPDPG